MKMQEDGNVAQGGAGVSLLKAFASIRVQEQEQHHILTLLHGGQELVPHEVEESTRDIFWCVLMGYVIHR